MKIWLAIEYHYDTATVRAAFEREEDARRFEALGLPVNVQEIDVCGPDETPPIVEGWAATAAVGVHDPTKHRPPKLTRRVFFAGDSPSWAHLRCEVETCGMNSQDVLELGYLGFDRDAVLAACQARYDRAVQGLAV